MSKGSNEQLKNIARITLIVVVVLGLLFGAGWLLLQIKTVLLYFIIAVIVSLIGKPIVTLLKKIQIGRFKLPMGVNALVALLVIYALVVGLGMVFVPLIVDQANNIASIDTNKAAEGIQREMKSLDEMIRHLQTESGEPHTVEQIINDKLKEWVNVTSVTNIFNQIIRSVGNLIIAIFSITFIAYFFLCDETLFTSIMLALTPEQYDEKMQRSLQSSKRYLTRYFIGTIIESAIVFIVISAGLFILGVPYALLIGFFAGIINIIPYVGPILAMMVGMLIAVITNLSINPNFEILPLLIELFILFQAVHVIDNYVIHPIIYSKSVKAHPLEIFIIVLIFGSLAGIPGMIVATPIYVLIRVIAREFFSQFSLVQKMTEKMNDDQ